MSSKVYRVDQIRKAEAEAVSQHLDTGFAMMQKAGNSAFEAFQFRWPEAKSVVVICGKGNNGGDGLIFANCAHQAGMSVKVITLYPLSSYTDSAKDAADLCIGNKVCIEEYQGELDLSGDIIIDALLGIGIQGEVREEYAAIINAVNAEKKPVLSIDVPSGLDAENGSVMGVAVEATLTVTFIALKQGLLTHHGPKHCGELVLKTLGLPETLLDTLTSSAEIMAWSDYFSFLPRRDRDAHKGEYGHVLIIGGDYGMGGAVRMSAEGAYRVGSGLVTVATRPEHVPVVCINRPEIMCHQVAKTKELEALLEKATVVVIGPGLGKSDWAEMLLECVLSYDHPKVLDADALNLLSKQPSHSEQWILTPHPGEAARLLETQTKEIQNDRFTAVDRLQQKYGGVSVLKGAGTLIKAENETIKICTAGNPGMASGGMGDVLSGVIGGLLAQKLSPSLSAQIGVMMHAMAADLAAEEGGERGLLATDLMQHLRQLVNPAS